MLALLELVEVAVSWQRSADGVAIGWIVGLGRRALAKTKIVSLHLSCALALVSIGFLCSCTTTRTIYM